MIGYIKGKLNELLKAVLDPVWERIIKKYNTYSTVIQFSIAIGIGILGFLFSWGISNKEEIIEGVRIARYLPNVIFDKNSSTIPIHDYLRTELLGEQDALKRSLRSVVLNPGTVDKDNSPWSNAQAISASIGAMNFKDQGEAIDKLRLAKFFDLNRDRICQCWKEIPDDSYLPHIPATSWVIYTLSKLDVPADDTEIEFLLGQQNSNGWWSVFNTHTNKDYASTYGTAWAMLALHSQLSKNLVSKALQQKVRDALDLGGGWLIQHQSNGRWKNYPESDRGQVSDSISGLVIHVLHRINSNSPSQKNLEHQWLRSLPEDPPTAFDFQSNYYWIRDKAIGDANDNFMQFPLPWMLIATADSYGSASNILQKAKTIEWLERALENKGLGEAETIRDFWWRAEILLSINYILDHSEPT